MVIAAMMVLLGAPSDVTAQTDQLLVDLAKEMYDFGDKEDALGIFLQAIEENPQNVKAQFYTGLCYLSTNWGKEQSVNYFKTAYDLDPEIDNDILFLIGEGYRFTYQFDKAIEYYLLYEEDLRLNRRVHQDKNIDKETVKTKRRIYECENGKEFVRRPQKVDITNLSDLGDGINSEDDDYAPVLSRDESFVIFTSRREGSTGELKANDNKYFEDLWISDITAGRFGPARNMGDKVNTTTHESNLSLSPDGNTLYMFIAENGGDIYFSENKKGNWTSPKSLGEPVNSESQELSVFISGDGSKMFLSSDRAGGMGGLDLYMLTKDAKGNWINPKNLGETINSEFHEEGPYFDDATQSLYFSSKGHKGMGGFDIFKSDYNAGSDTWSKPVNLGYPVNTTDDDLYFTLSNDGRTGFYSSHKEDSRGGTDLYMITPEGETFGDPDNVEDVVVNDTAGTGGPEDGALTTADSIRLGLISDPSDLGPVKPVKVAIRIIDFKTRQPIDATVEVVHKVSGTTVDKQSISGGAYSTEFTNTEDREYIVLVEAPGFLFQSVMINVPIATPAENVIQRTMSLRTEEVFVPNVLRNIYFGFDKYNITMQSTAELDKLQGMMSRNPAMKVEIAGHTDFVGTPEYNQHLSQLRANSVKQYLIRKGVNPASITSKGYGENHPIATNDDETEGRALNRRTEFIILSK